MPKLIAAQLTAIVEQAPVAMAVAVVRDEACVFQYANAAFYRLIEEDSDEFINSAVSDFFEVSDESLQENTNSSLQWRGFIVNATWIQDTKPRCVLFTVTPHEGEQQRADFIATLTHDLKTPIVGANMVLTALLDGTVGELHNEQAEIIAKLRNSNQALLKMIQNLLEVYKYESGSESLRFDGANLADIVSFCVDDVKPIAASKRINIDVMCPKKEMLLICDEYAIKRVLINLLGNAVKFTAEGGTISVRAFDDAENAHLVVKDTGRGINSVDRSRLFQRFWQGDPGRRYSAGTGLGLYFCHNVIRAHGGNIRCDSEIGHGTTFTIDLPKHVYAQ